MRILYIDIDSLRPDHLGCYGYGRETSPHMDRLAAEGLRFTRCHVSDAPCMPSRTSLFSGLFGIRHGCVSHTGSRATPYPEGEKREFKSEWGRSAWMEQLRRIGMRTAAITPFVQRHDAWHWAAGFHDCIDPGEGGHEIATTVLPLAQEWLDRHGQEEDWFLHLNFWDVHVPYRTPREYGNWFASIPLTDAWLTPEMLETHARDSGIRSVHNALFLNASKQRPDLNPAQLKTEADVKLMVDAYDTAVRFVDDAIGRLIEHLQQLGIEKETAIIISADHGECLGELNAYGGHCFADACTTQVPLIIRWPGVTDARAGESDDRFLYQGDLAPTVCELLDAEIPDAWDFVSMRSAFTDARADGRESLVVSQLAQTCQRGVRWNHAGKDYFYLRTFRTGFYAMPEEQLFCLTDDPHETTDLALEEGEILELGRMQLERWEATHRVEGRDPLQEVLVESSSPMQAMLARRLTRLGQEHLVETLSDQPRPRRRQRHTES